MNWRKCILPLSLLHVAKCSRSIAKKLSTETNSRNAPTTFYETPDSYIMPANTLPHQSIFHALIPNGYLFSTPTIYNTLSPFTHFITSLTLLFYTTNLASSVLILKWHSIGFWGSWFWWLLCCCFMLWLGNLMLVAKMGGCWSLLKTTITGLKETDFKSMTLSVSPIYLSSYFIHQSVFLSFYFTMGSNSFE